MKLTSDEANPSSFTKIFTNLLLSTTIYTGLTGVDPETKFSPNVPSKRSSCMTPKMFPFQPSPLESVIVMVRIVEVGLGHPPSGQKVPKTVVAVKVVPGVLVAMVVPFSALIVNPI